MSLNDQGQQRWDEAVCSSRADAFRQITPDIPTPLTARSHNVGDETLA